MVNPGGTGSPALVISARPEPLPPSVSFIVRSPSAFPLPKKYTNFVGFKLRALGFGPWALGGEFRSVLVRRASLCAIRAFPLKQFRKYLQAAGSVSRAVSAAAGGHL